ncbi:YrhB domain-containing protein [Nonomuraea aurantiaca]|uniref:YrhB domain-containing protein n=1 Tax=Nonomuraea aurantiaca TaxID=2878562 RepID=UPI001CDA518D|nr:YrhB domain-containing protein [Nonomuraea aurantiaca]MCA2229739.1 YrhB family protein [Nonomuraea aurantiaca]
MIGKEEAEQLVRAFIKEELSAVGESLVVHDAETVERPYGWFFTITTAEFVETGDPGTAYAGLGPVLVRRADSGLMEFDSMYTGEAAAEAYEAGL